MPRYQFRREQRVDFEAEDLQDAERIMCDLDLASADDESDDPGELEELDEDTTGREDGDLDPDPFFPDQGLVASGLHYTDQAAFETTEDDPTEDDPDVDWSLRPDMVKPAPKGPSFTRRPTKRSVLEAVLHQLSTDSDLDTVTGAAKYKALVTVCREALAPLADDDPTQYLDDEECRAALRSVIKLLWWDTDDDDVAVANPEKEWNGDTQMELSRWAADFDVCPHPDDEGGEE